MLQTIDTHTVDVKRLDPKGWALDVGCRGFGFARAMRDMGLKVIAMDPDPDLLQQSLESQTGFYFRMNALVGSNTKRTGWYAKFGDGCANHLCISRDDVPGYAAAVEVKCEALPELMTICNVPHFSAIKLDCEGAEYEILEALTEPVADQISVEFHDFLGAGFNPCWPDIEAYYRRLLAGRFGEMYEIVQHERTPLNGNGPMNYWDTLFVAKEPHRAH